MMFEEQEDKAKALQVNLGSSPVIHLSAIFLTLDTTSLSFNNSFQKPFLHLQTIWWLLFQISGVKLN